jgi:hypothetical protein
VFRTFEEKQKTITEINSKFEKLSGFITNECLELIKGLLINRMQFIKTDSVLCRYELVITKGVAAEGDA